MANVQRHMELRQNPGDPPLIWDLKANSMVEMISQARAICEEHQRKFTPHDVLVFDSPQNIADRKAADEKEKKTKSKPVKKEKMT